MKTTPRKARKKCWCGAATVTLNGHCKFHGLPDHDDTPRKATTLKVRPTKYGGIEKYAVEMVYEDRRDAEAHVRAVNCHAELVHMVDELTRWAESVEGKQVSIGATRWEDSIFTQARKLIARATGEKTK